MASLEGLSSNGLDISIDGNISSNPNASANHPGNTVNSMF
jgi:hypothetical protein